MTDQLAATQYRVIGPLAAQLGPSDSLASLNTTPLPDGALALIQQPSLGDVWMLNKDTTAAASIADVSQVSPVGGGTWQRLFGFQGNRESAAAFANSRPDLVVAADTWAPVAGGDFVFSISTSGLFVLTAASGLLTFQGPTERSFRVELLASLANTAAAAAIRLAAAISFNGDVAGAATNFAFQQEVTTNAVQDQPMFVGCTRDLSIEPGDTVQPVFKNITDGTDISLAQCAITITILP